jgi:hypothetical protein
MENGVKNLKGARLFPKTFVLDIATSYHENGDAYYGEKHIDKKLFLFKIIIHAKRKWKKTDSEEYPPLLSSLLLLLLLREGGSLRLLPFPDPPIKNPKDLLIYKS